MSDEEKPMTEEEIKRNYEQAIEKSGNIQISTDEKKLAKTDEETTKESEKSLDSAETSSKITKKAERKSDFAQKASEKEEKIRKKDKTDSKKSKLEEKPAKTDEPEAKKVVYSLFQTLIKRRSVRKYDMTPLEDDDLAEIRGYVSQIRQLDGCYAGFKFVEPKDVKDKKAPHYILCFCEPTTENYINVGFVLQKADLYMQSMGYGAVWLGSAKTEEILKEENFCIMMAFGKTTIPLRYGDIDFDRLPTKTICDTDNPINEFARLAPSAMNSQPWKIEYLDNKIIVRYHKRRMLFFRRLLLKKMSKIDIGIISRFIWTYLEQEKKTGLTVTPFVEEKSFGTVIEYDIIAESDENKKRKEAMERMKKAREDAKINLNRKPEPLINVKVDEKVKADEKVKPEENVKADENVKVEEQQVQEKTEEDIKSEEKETSDKIAEKKVDA